MSSDRTVRWGVLSTARIGLQKVIPAIRAGRLGRVTAIASRDPERARAAAVQKIAVFTAAGVTQFTRTPVSASSLPNDLVRAITPALLAL